MSLRQRLLLSQVNHSPEELLLIASPSGESGCIQEGVSQARSAEHAVDGTAGMVPLEHQPSVAKWFVHALILSTFVSDERQLEFLERPLFKALDRLWRTTPASCDINERLIVEVPAYNNIALI